MKDNVSDSGICLASGEDTSVTPQAKQAIREAATTISTCIAGLVDTLEEPLKTKFLEVKAQINQMLAGLPETDKVPAAHESNYLLRGLLSVMTSAQAMITNLSEVAKSAKSDLVAARNSIPGEVETAIAAKITAGDLFKKEDVQGKIDDAVNAARDEFSKTQKQVSDRRTALASASLPVPTDDTFLVGEEKDFDARKTTAAERIEKLKGFNLSSARLAELAWAQDAKVFDNAFALLSEAVQTSKPSNRGPNPFIKATAKPAAENDLKVRFGCC